MLERLRRWWRRLLCSLRGHDDERLWRDVLPLLPPEPAPKPVVVPDGPLVAVVTLVQYNRFNAYEFSESRCRRCGRRKINRGVVCSSSPIRSERYIELPADRYEDDGDDHIWRKNT